MGLEGFNSSSSNRLLLHSLLILVCIFMWFSSLQRSEINRSLTTFINSTSPSLQEYSRKTIVLDTGSLPDLGGEVYRFIVSIFRMIVYVGTNDGWGDVVPGIMSFLRVR